MTKRFDIHNWQAKHLFEQDDFTPDLEDDELKRGAIRQMLDKEKPQTPQDVPRGTLNNAIADLAEMYSYGEILDALKVFYTDNDELPFAEMAKKHAKEFREFLDSEEELDEQNSLGAAGSGMEVTTGDGMGYMQPQSFAKKGKWKRKNEKHP